MDLFLVECVDAVLEIEIFIMILLFSSLYRPAALFAPSETRHFSFRFIHVRASACVCVCVLSFWQRSHLNLRWIMNLYIRNWCASERKQLHAHTHHRHIWFLPDMGMHRFTCFMFFFSSVCVDVAVVEMLDFSATHFWPSWMADRKRWIEWKKERMAGWRERNYSSNDCLWLGLFSPKKKKKTADKLMSRRQKGRYESIFAKSRTDLSANRDPIHIRFTLWRKTMKVAAQMKWISKIIVMFDCSLLLLLFSSSFRRHCWTVVWPPAAPTSLLTVTTHIDTHTHTAEWKFFHANAAPFVVVHEILIKRFN